ncbi:hypothetical protein BH09SUM1_BH09SUM1_21660 [soil metagenome]
MISHHGKKSSLALLMLSSALALTACAHKGSESSSSSSTSSDSSHQMSTHGDLAKKDDPNTDAMGHPLGRREAAPAAPAPKPMAAAAPVAPAPRPVVAEPLSGSTWVILPDGDPDHGFLRLESSGPSEVSAGRAFHYTIKATNVSKNVQLRNVVVKEAVAPNVTVTNSSVPRTGSGDYVTYALGTLQPGESKTIDVEAHSDAEGEIVICVSADYEPFICWTAKITRPEITVKKSGPASVSLCDPIIYQVVVTNTGSGVAHSVKLTDSLPDGVVTTDGRTSIDETIGDLNPGESDTITINAKPTRTGSFSNRAIAMGEGIEVPSNDVVTVVTAPKLTITKNAPSADYASYASDNFDYTIVVTNTGDGDAKNTTITDTLPAGLSFVSASNGGTGSGSSATWNLGTLAPSESREVKITVVGTQSGQQCNVVKATAECAPPVEARSCVQIVTVAGVLLEVIDTKDPIRVGEEETFEIRVTNQGDTVLTGINIDAVLEAMEYISATGPTAAQGSGQTITFNTLPTLAAKASQSWTVKAKTLQAADARFLVNMHADQIDADRPVRETESTTIYEAGKVRDIDLKNSQKMNP